MMTIEKDVLFFDTETTGVPDYKLSWETDFNKYPHIVQLAWIYRGKEHSYIIKPEGWEIPEEAVAVHGITTEQAIKEGKPIEEVLGEFIGWCLNAKLICGHNIHFDTSIIKANILRRFGPYKYDAARVEEALYKGKRIDTMRPSMKWVDARTSNGRMKFPRLEELYSRCFPGESFPAHDALADTKAVARCLPVLLKLGLVELKVKEYPGEEIGKFVAAQPVQTDSFGRVPLEKAHIAPILNAKPEDDKLPVGSVQGPQIANSAKITDSAVELLNQNDF